MAITNGTLVKSKRRTGPRRRRQDKPAVSAKLVLDDQIEGDEGCLSEDLFRELFPHAAASDSTVYVALAPWTPQAVPTETPWSVVPVSYSSTYKGPSKIFFSPSSPYLQRFAVALQQLAPSKLAGHSRSGIDVLVLDAAPLPLETVYINLDNELVRRLEAGEGTFYKKHPNAGPRGKATLAEDRLATALREALSGLMVIHVDDLFPLPLPPHPVTHVPPSPGKIVLCEPVAQGVIVDTTKIILTRSKTRGPGRGGPPAIHPGRRLNSGDVKERDDEDDEGAMTDQFFSAAEDRDRSMTATETELATDTETEMSATDLGEDDDSLSDDSMDDMISLQAPALHATSASGISTMQPGTPRTIGTIRGRKTNGATTPGSVFSNFTSATARPDRPRGRLFRAQGLMRPMPIDLLHPKPTSEEDDEARIYVHVSALPKIGCFSGDWVRIEVAQEPPANGLGMFGLGSFGGDDAEVPGNWRPVRVFGLPEGYSQKPMTRLPSSKHGERSFSFFESQVQRPASPTAFASPLLLANLDDALYLRIAPLKKSSYQGKGTLPRFTSASRPPYAKDISIHHIRTPISAERAFQTAVLGGLKHYFASKVRLVRTGDLIAVPVDSHLGKALQEVTGSGGSEVDDVMALTSGGVADQPSMDSVAWFKVGHIQIHKTDEDEDSTAEAFWGSVACIDSSSVGMHGSGFETSRIPGTKQSTWQHYLGLKKAPRKDSDAPSLPLPLSDMQQQYVSPLRHQLRQLLAAATSKRAIHLKMPPVAILLTSTHRNIGKSTLAGDACSDIGLHTYAIDAYDILSEGGGSGSDVKTEGFLRTRAERAMSCGPDCCALLVRHVEALTADRIESTMKEVLEDTRVLIATTNEVDKVPDGVRALFTHELEMGAPDEAERESILRRILDDRGVGLEPSIDLNAIALKTAALVAGDLVDVVDRASAAQQSRLEALVTSPDAVAAGATVRDVQVAGGPMARCLTKGDLDAAVEAARKSFSDSIGAPKIPNVTWDDVGGLSNVKAAVTETIQLPLERPELFAKGMKKRSGILFYGPPGTGKTLLAKAIATEYSLNFFSVKGPELLNMYIGESEANVRRVFQRARDARPCVVFFDELDSVAPKRGNQGDSGGVMDRIVSQLLAELDGMSGSDDGAAAGGVFVIGATNRPDLLDPALLRPGRFDKMLYLGVSDTHEKQLTILQALTRKFTLDPTLSLRNVANSLPMTYTGADFYALCSDAMLKAVTRQANLVDSRISTLSQDREYGMSTAYFFDHHASPEDLAVMVREEDFLGAMRELIPSVSQGELEHYEKVRASFEGDGDKRPESKGKGKGKAVEEVDDDEKRRRRKGKGKAPMGFQDGGASDDDDLY